MACCAAGARVLLGVGEFLLPFKITVRLLSDDLLMMDPKTRVCRSSLCLSSRTLHRKMQLPTTPSTHMQRPCEAEGHRILTGQ